MGLSRDTGRLSELVLESTPCADQAAGAPTMALDAAKYAALSQTVRALQEPATSRVSVGGLQALALVLLEQRGMAYVDPSTIEQCGVDKVASLVVLPKATFDSALIDSQLLAKVLSDNPGPAASFSGGTAVADFVRAHHSLQGPSSSASRIIGRALGYPDECVDAFADHLAQNGRIGLNPFTLRVKLAESYGRVVTHVSDVADIARSWTTEGLSREERLALLLADLPAVGSELGLSDEVYEATQRECVYRLSTRPYGLVGASWGGPYDHRPSEDLQSRWEAALRSGGICAQLVSQERHFQGVIGPFTPRP